MANVFDTAKYILEQSGSMSAMKLRELLLKTEKAGTLLKCIGLFSDHFTLPVTPYLLQ